MMIDTERRTNTTSFQELGIDYLFKPQPLGYGFYICEVNLPGLKRSPTITVVEFREYGQARFNRVGLILSCVDGDNIIPFGFASFEWNLGKSQQPRFSNGIAFLLEQMSRKLPILDKTYQKYQKTRLGLIIDHPLRENGYGGTLWALTCGYFETHGAERIMIIDDVTFLQKPRDPEGFYHRYGAQPISGSCGLDGRIASTHLSDEQKMLVRQALKISPY